MDKPLPLTLGFEILAFLFIFNYIMAWVGFTLYTLFKKYQRKEKV